MEQFVINARRRELTGTGPSRQYRRDGYVPATVYGRGKEAASILVVAKELQAFLRHHGSLATLNIEGESETGGLGALVQEVQRHPISREVLSADFLWVSLTESVTVNVPLHLVGDAPGVKVQGGSLEQTLHEISIACLPGTIPDFIEVDISGLHTGQSLHVSDITPTAGVTIMTPAEEAVAVITKGVKAEDLEVHVEGEEAAAEEPAEE
jgi:large subunit ribosomal protein L25